MPKQTFLTPHTYVPKSGQSIKEKSLTVPDQSLTVKDILKKTLGGNLPAISRNVGFGGKSIIHTIPIDITEMETSARNIKRRLDAEQAAEEEAIQAKNRAQAEKEANEMAEFRKWKEQNPS